jgi:hypothetical protein
MCHSTAKSVGDDGHCSRPCVEVGGSAQIEGRCQVMLLADIQDVREEEVTRAGVQLRIIEQHTRGHDGRAFVWRGREKRA